MKRALPVVVVVWLSSVPVSADEGMWTFDALPSKKMSAAYGFVPDAAWLQRARLATVQLPGCTGSFVSNNGLIMTNHHCADDCLRTLSSVKKVNYLQQPFVAKTLAQEVVCPDAEAQQLQSTEDVTAKVREATKGVPPEKFHAALDAVTNTLEKACVGDDVNGTSCELVNLYHGGQYLLFRYKRFKDLRMVFAPEMDIASFGGDPDNFNFPRYNLDVTFLRAYENGKPAVTPDAFGWRPEGAKAGEPVFVPGHPGRTDRLLTVAELEYARDVTLPQALMDRSYRRGLWHEYARTSAKGRELLTVTLEGLENGIKVRRNEQLTLADPRLMAQKRAEEQALRQAVSKDAALSKQVGDPWSEIAAILVKSQALTPRQRALTFTNSKLYDFARTLVRAAAQRKLPEAERLPEYTDRELAKLERTVTAPTPAFVELEERSLFASLYLMRDELGTDDPTVKSLLGRKAPATLAHELATTSKLYDPAVRKALLLGGQAAVDASKDPMVLFAKALDPEVLAVRKRIEDEVTGPRARASERVAQAYFAVHQKDTYPDATFTLRLSYGSVKGWVRRDGVTIEPFTTIDGVFARATGEDPYVLPKTWLAAKAKLNGSTPFNFVTDNDIVGGNSGSPMVDKEGRVVGLAFDGNIESIGGNYWFDETVNRCVGVHPAAIVEALRVVYGAGALADELTKSAPNGKM